MVRAITFLSAALSVVSFYGTTHAAPFNARGFSNSTSATPFFLNTTSSLPTSDPTPVLTIVSTPVVVETVTVTVDDSRKASQTYQAQSGGSAGGAGGQGGSQSGRGGAGGQGSQSTNYPTATLLPAVEKGQDLSNPQNLKLNESVQVFHAEQTQQGNDSAVAWVTYTQLNYHVVALDKSNQIQSIQCSAGKAELVLKSDVAYQVAAADWANHPKDFLFLVYTPGCGSGYAKGERDWLLVSNVSLDPAGRKITASFTVIDINQAVGETNPIKVDLGSFSPSGKDSFNLTGETKPFGSNSTTGNSTRPSNSTTEDFDIYLDNLIGYGSSSDPILEKQLMPGVDGLDEISFDGSADTPELTTRSLQKRGWWSWITKKISQAVTAVKNVVVAVATVVKDVAVTAISTAVKAVSLLNPWQSHTFTPLDKTLNLDYGKGTDTTPWGVGSELYKTSGQNGQVGIYCVGCGVNGKIQIKGSFTFSLAKGISQGGLKADGDLHAGLGIGIDATYENSWNYQKQLFAVPLSPLSIPALLTIGPQVSMSAGGDLSVAAKGQLLAGVSLDWPAIQVNIDLLDSSKSIQNGLTPTVTPIFKVKGTIDAKLEAYIIVSIEVVVDILNGKFKKGVSLNDKPSIVISAKGEAQAGLVPRQEDDTQDPPVTPGTPADDPDKTPATTTPGLSASGSVCINIALKNDVYIDLLGLKRFDIFTWSWDAYSKCASASTSKVKRHLAIGGVVGRGLSPRQATLTIAPNPTTPIVTATGTPPAVTATPAASIVPAKTNTTTPSNSTKDDTQYDIITSLDGEFSLHYADNGNLHAVPGAVSSANGLDKSGVFASQGDLVFGDSGGRMLHAYVDTMASLGVSRIRLHRPEKIPKTSVFVSLTPVDEPGDTPSILVATTSAGDVYYPLVCVYAASTKISPKLFLAKDMEAGAKTLADPKLQATLTGGEITQCAFMQWENGEQGV